LNKVLECAWYEEKGGILIIFPNFPPSCMMFERERKLRRVTFNLSNAGLSVTLHTCRVKLTLQLIVIGISLFLLFIYAWAHLSSFIIIFLIFNLSILK